MWLSHFVPRKQRPWPSSRLFAVVDRSGTMLRKVASTAHHAHLETLTSRNPFGIAGPSRSQSNNNNLTADIPSDVKSTHHDIIEKLRYLLHESRNTPINSRRELKAKLPNEDGERRLLRPSILSARVKRLCDAGALEPSITMVQNAPLDAQNTIVWNTLISEALKVKRYAVAYKLYTDMKRRGMKPTTGTFVTMFAGLAKIDDWEAHMKQMANCQSLHEHYLRHIESVKAHNPKSEQISVLPIALYMRILAAAHQHQKIFDIFYEMDEQGPMAPNEYIFGAMFLALNSRKSSEKTDGLSPAAQNASDAKLLWRQVVKASEQRGLIIDSHVVTPALRVLSKGRPTDQTFAFDIIRDYLGLARPGETPIPAKFPLSSFALQAVLELCNTMQKYRLCIHYAQQVMDRRLARNEHTILSRRHIEQVLIAYASPTVMGSLSESTQALETIKWMLRNERTGHAPEQLQPEQSTYNLALMACWRGGDWHTAAELFEIMTSRRAADFRDPAPGEMRPTDNAPPAFRAWRPLRPDAHTMSCLVRAAWASRDRANMRQCLRMVDHYGAETFFTAGRALEASAGRSARNAGRHDGYAVYYQSKLATDLVKMVDYVLAGRASTDDASARRWQALRDKAHRAQEPLRRSADRVTEPSLERPSSLGSRSGLEMMQEAIDFQMATRQT